MYKSIHAIKKANRLAGGFWFSPGAMDHSSTRIESPVIDGKYFVYSLQGDPKWNRYFKVGFADPTGRVHALGPVMGYSTAEEAISHIVQDMTEFSHFLN
jgi:hypothetical protein